MNELSGKGHAPLAQLDRASGYGPEGREFESLTAYHQAEVLRRKASGLFLCMESMQKTKDKHHGKTIAKSGETERNNPA